MSSSTGPVALNTAATAITNVCAVCLGQARPPFTALKLCGGCQSARYCSVEHQKEHWPTHKTECKRLKEHWAKLRDGKLASGSPDPHEFMAWIGRNWVVLKVACQQAFELHDPAKRELTDGVAFHVRARCDTSLPVGQQFSVHSVEMLPYSAVARLYPGFDGAGQLARFQSQPETPKHGRTIVGGLRSGEKDMQVHQEPYRFEDADLDQMVPDPDWRKTLTDAVTR